MGINKINKVLKINQSDYQIIIKQKKVKTNENKPTTTTVWKIKKLDC